MTLDHTYIITTATPPMTDASIPANETTPETVDASNPTLVDATPVTTSDLLAAASRELASQHSDRVQAHLKKRLKEIASMRKALAKAEADLAALTELTPEEIAERLDLGNGWVDLSAVELSTTTAQKAAERAARQRLSAYRML